MPEVSGVWPFEQEEQRPPDAECPSALESKSEAEGENGYRLLRPPFQGQSASESHSETKEKRGSFTCAPITTIQPTYDPKAQLILRFSGQKLLQRLSRFFGFFRVLLLLSLCLCCVLLSCFFL